MSEQHVQPWGVLLVSMANNMTYENRGDIQPHPPPPQPFCTLPPAPWDEQQTPAPRTNLPAMIFSTQYVCRLSGCLSTASQSVTVDPRWITGMEELSKSETEPIIGHILNVFFSKCLPETRSRFALIIHFTYYCCVYWMVKLQAALTLLSCSLFSIKILHNLWLHDSKRKSHLP